MKKTQIKLSFEFNGLYWHSDEYKDRMYHINKTKKCLEMGITLIHIWEDDWCQKKDIVKSIILNKLGENIENRQDNYSNKSIGLWKF